MQPHTHGLPTSLLLFASEEQVRLSRWLLARISCSGVTAELAAVHALLDQLDAAAAELKQRLRSAHVPDFNRSGEHHH